MFMLDTHYSVPKTNLQQLTEFGIKPVCSAIYMTAPLLLHHILDVYNAVEDIGNL